MKTLLTLSALAIMSASYAPQAHAAVATCDGTTNVPIGKFALKVKSAQSGPLAIAVRFHNDQLNEDFDGRFVITDFQSTDGSILAKGEFHAADGKIPATIQGSLTPNSSGKTVLAVYAADRRIKYGFGLWLSCELKD